MAYVVDDVSGFTVDFPLAEKKFPWALLIVGIIAAGTITMIVKKEG